MLGGGTFISKDKVLPGAYINFVSSVKGNASLSDRGYVALPLELDWGVDGEIFTVTQSEFLENSIKIFGYDYSHDKLKGLRDLFKNAQVAYIYKLNTGVKASNTYATAKYTGLRGNDIKIVITVNVDEVTKFDVATLLDNALVDTQTVAFATELVNNDYVDFITSATLVATSGTSLTGGTNGAEITGTDYQAFLDKLESYSFNTLGCLSMENTIKVLFVNFTNRMRDEVGAKFQTVLHKYNTADYEGIISVENSTTGINLKGSELVYWVLGAEGSCAVNKSCTNKKYNGEYVINTDYTQTQLKDGIKAGKFMFHKVADEIRVLTDINTLVTLTVEKGTDFSSNQTVRLIDQIANDTATLFNTKYLGNIPNDASGRISLWNDIVTINKQLESIRAIENFDSKLVVVTQGDTKKQVIVNQTINPVNCMEQLYMSVVIE